MMFGKLSLNEQITASCMQKGSGCASKESDEHDVNKVLMGMSVIMIFMYFSIAMQKYNYSL